MLRAMKVGAGGLMIAAFAGVLGTAGAQDPTASPSPARTVTANGSGETTIATTAGQADRESAYRGALGDAIDRARSRAAFLADKGGVQLGAAVDDGDHQRARPLLRRLRRAGLREGRRRRSGGSPRHAQAHDGDEDRTGR
jgi:uncharacterized protein YggE